VAERSHGARTEEATPRRLAEARRQGQLAVSRELTGAVALAAVFVVLALGGAAGIGQLIGYLRGALATAGAGGSTGAALHAGLKQGLSLLALPLGIALFAIVVAGVAQTGGLVTLVPLRFQAGRVAPSLGRVFGGAALARVVKGMANVLVLAGIVVLSARPWLRPLGSLVGASAGRVLRVAGAMATALGWRLLVAALALGALDLIWLRQRHRRSLRMTRDEVERERKHHEGDPRHKAARLHLYRELAEQRLLSEVASADFLVVGPQRATALRQVADSAPVVVASGARLVAAQIKELARKAAVPTFHDPALAGALGAVEEGSAIPEELYTAVAEIVKVILQTSRSAP
jgi:flagellar biosynthesis protein FlhB